MPRLANGLVEIENSCRQLGALETTETAER